MGKNQLRDSTNTPNLSMVCHTPFIHLLLKKMLPVWVVSFPFIIINHSKCKEDWQGELQNENLACQLPKAYGESRIFCQTSRTALISHLHPDNLHLDGERLLF
jgi:hypothetical protein